MTSLPRFSVHNPVLVNLFMVTIIGGGVYCSFTIVREMFPESRPNRILISTSYPGATPSEVEKGIALRIEEEIKDVDGVDKITSTVDEGVSTIFVELESGFKNVDQAVNDVKAAIDTIPAEDFPEEALETSVAKFDPRLPVISIALYGKVDDRTLKTLGERLRQDALALSDVTDVVVSGTRKDEISVEVSPEKLIEFGLSFMQVSDAIAKSNLDLPGGQVRTLRANVAVRTLGEKDRGDELYDIVLKSDPSGRVLRLRDVARIVDGFEDVDVIGRFNGAPAVNVTIYKTGDQDSINIAEKIRALVAGKMNRPLERDWFGRLKASLPFVTDEIGEIYEASLADPYPPGVSFTLHTDLSRFVEGRLELLTRNGLWGLVLVSLSLLLFLHWRVAFWVVMGLLLAIMGSLIFMRLLGYTLNLITMFGLIIVLGLLVDDAIIVAEHVYSKVEGGMEPIAAAIEGTEAVSWPVVCAILTTIVAFFPLMFIDGQIGDWIGTLPVIVCLALTVSLIEALSILPSHLAHGIRPLSRRGALGSDRRRRGGLRRFVQTIRVVQERYFQRRLRRAYEYVLRQASIYRYVTIAALFSCLLVTGGLVAGGHVPYVFLQNVDSETLVARLEMEVGAPMERTSEATAAIEEAASKLPEIKTMYALIGINVTDEGMASAPRAHVAQVFFELCPGEQRTRTSDDIMLVLREMTSAIPGVQRLSYTALEGGPGGAPIHLDIRGERLDDLIAVSEDVKQQLRSYDGVFDVVDNFDAGRPEVQIELFDSARALGMTTQSLATQVRSAFYGFEARKIQRGREDVKIMVRYPPEYRRHIYDIERMRVASGSGALVPFTEVASLTEGTGYGSITRIDQKRTVTVKADIDQDVTEAELVMAGLSKRFGALVKQYPGVTLSFGGQKLETSRAFGSLKQSFVIALVLIYVILAGLFKSYIQPIIVIAVVPFGLIGAVTGHLVLGYPLTMLSMIGIVALTGIVVNDSMILVKFINERVEAGSEMFEAVIEGGKSRLRPILLTSATTVLGVAPLMMERSFQAKFLIPMAVSISAGLLFATVLTLVAVPSLYLITADIKRALSGIVSPRAGQPAAA